MRNEKELNPQQAEIASQEHTRELSVAFHDDENLAVLGDETLRRLEQGGTLFQERHPDGGHDVEHGAVCELLHRAFLDYSQDLSGRQEPEWLVLVGDEDDRTVQAIREQSGGCAERYLLGEHGGESYQLAEQQFSIRRQHARQYMPCSNRFLVGQDGWSGLYRF